MGEMCEMFHPTVLMVPSIVYKTVDCFTAFCGDVAYDPELWSTCTLITKNSTLKCNCRTYVQEAGVYCTTHYGDTVEFYVDSKIRERVLEVRTKNINNAHFSLLFSALLSYLNWSGIREFHYTNTYISENLANAEAVIADTKSLYIPDGVWRSRVRVFSLTLSCLSNIYGILSDVFPLLTELRLNNNILNRLHSDIFQNLGYIKKLDLSYNLLDFTENKFPVLDLSSLEYLDLSFNQIHELESNILCGLDSLRVLNISGNDLQSLPPRFFYCIPELREINLSSCKISSLAETGINRLAKLERLALRDNNFMTLPYEVFFSYSSFVAGNLTHLTFLDMSKNCLYENSNTSSSIKMPVSSQKTIENLRCKSCCLDAKKAGYVANWVTRSVTFRENEIALADLDFLQSIAHLKIVHIEAERLGTMLYVIDKQWYYLNGTQRHNFTSFKPNQLRPMQLKIKLDLMHHSHVNRQKTVTQLYITTFSHLECELIAVWATVKNMTQSLKFTLMSSNISLVVNDWTLSGQGYSSLDGRMNDLICNYTIYCPEKCACFIQGFSEIVIVNCTGKYLSTFPDTEQFHNHLKLFLNNNCIQQFPDLTGRNWEKLVEIHLENNCIGSLDTLKLTPQLQRLDLRNNRLKDFNVLKKWLPLKNNQVQLLLSGNPWRCDCETHNVKTGNVVDFFNVSCTSVYSNRLLLLSSATDTEICPEDSLLLLKVGIPVLATIIVLVILVAFVYYRNKAAIKYWLFTHGICLWFINEEDIDADKTYDAFVSYSSVDEEWVADHLVRGLEAEPPFYKLCLHNRDWPVGGWISEQIFLSVHQSRRTIIVLTDNFMHSDWSRLEFRIAYHQSLADKINRLLIVLPGDVPETANIDEQLRSFLNLNSYVKEDDPNFWLKLRAAMPNTGEGNQQEKHQQELQDNTDGTPISQKYSPWVKE